MNDVSAVRQTPLDGKYKPGDSFLEACRELTEPWKDNIGFTQVICPASAGPMAPSSSCSLTQ